MEKKVTIIITTYNRSLNILSRAVESAMNQDYKNKQIIIVNAAPENFELKTKIRNYVKEKELEYYELDKNSNACVARNYGIEKSKGEYIALLDDDDEWLPEKISMQISKFENQKVGMVYCSFYYINKNNTKIVKFGDKEGNVQKQLLKKNIIGGCSVPLILKKAFEECGKFDIDFKSSQDYDMWIRICQKYEVRHIDKPLVKYYISEDSITKSIEKRISGWEKILEKYEDIYRDDPNSYNYFLNVIACELVKNREIKKGLEYFKKAIKIKKITINNFMIFKGFLKNIIKR